MKVFNIFFFLQYSKPKKCILFKQYETTEAVLSEQWKVNNACSNFNCCSTRDRKIKIH